MDIQKHHEILRQSLHLSSLLAQQARMEQELRGEVNTVCPKCRERLTITMTTKGERTIVRCKCGYVYSEDINL